MVNGENNGNECFFNSSSFDMCPISFSEWGLPSKNEHLNLLKSTLELVNCLRLDHWNLMPYSVKEQISVEPSDPGSYEVIYLLGRCFNLSMNSKILQQCEYTDPMMAEKLLKDFHNIVVVEVVPKLV